MALHVLRHVTSKRDGSRLANYIATANVARSQPTGASVAVLTHVSREGMGKPPSGNAQFPEGFVTTPQCALNATAITFDETKHPTGVRRSRRSPGLNCLGAPGYFVTYWNNPAMLLIGGIAAGVMARVEMRI